MKYLSRVLELCANLYVGVASWYCITLIHMFLGNLLMSHNPSVMCLLSPICLDLTISRSFNFCYITMISCTVPKYVESLCHPFPTQSYLWQKFISKTTMS